MAIINTNNNGKDSGKHISNADDYNNNDGIDEYSTYCHYDS